MGHFRVFVCRVAFCPHALCAWRRLLAMIHPSVGPLCFVSSRMVPVASSRKHDTCPVLHCMGYMWDMLRCWTHRQGGRGGHGAELQRELVANFLPPGPMDPPPRIPSTEPCAKRPPPPPRREGTSTCSKVHGAQGTEEKFSSGYHGGNVRFRSLCMVPPRPGGVGCLMTAPPREWGCRCAFWGTVHGAGRVRLEGSRSMPVGMSGHMHVCRC